MEMRESLLYFQIKDKEGIKLWLKLNLSHVTGSIGIGILVVFVHILHLGFNKL